MRKKWEILFTKNMKTNIKNSQYHILPILGHTTPPKLTSLKLGSVLQPMTIYIRYDLRFGQQYGLSTEYYGS